MAKKSLLKSIFGSAKRPERPASKNTATQQILTRMADDINITKLNVIKLVEIQKETPAMKAEDFFDRQKEKEDAYEQGFRRGSGGASSKSPSRTGPGVISKGANSNPFDLLRFLFNKLIQGGILAGLGYGLLKILESPENRTKISDFLRDFFEGFLKLVKLGAETLNEVLTGDKDGKIKEGIIGAFQAIVDLLVTAIGKIGDILADKRIWEGLYKIIEAVFKAIYDILNTEIEIKGMKMKLANVVLIVAGTMWALHLAAAKAALSLGSIGSGLPGRRVPGGDIPGGPGKKGPGATNKIGRAAFWIALAETVRNGAPWIYENFFSDFKELSPEEIAQLTPEARSLYEESKKQHDLTSKKVEAAGTAAAAVGLGAAAIKNMPKKPAVTPKVTTPTPTTRVSPILDQYGKPIEVSTVSDTKKKSMLTKLKDFFSKLIKKPALYEKFEKKLIVRVSETVAKRLMVFVGSIIAMPITGGLSGILTILMAAMSVYDLILLYDLVFGKDGLYDEIMKEDTEPEKVKPVTEAELAIQQRKMHEAGKTYGSAINRKENAEYIAATKKTYEAEKAKYDQMQSAVIGSKPTPTAPTGQQTNPVDLLETIAGGESSRGVAGYDIANKKISSNKYAAIKFNPGELSSKTIGEIQQMQKKGDIFAAGKYQITPNTLQGLLRGDYGDEGRLPLDTRFSPEIQDLLANTLIKKRLKNAGSDPIEQQYQLSQEFAAIPVPVGKPLANGRISTGVESYYSGIGGNKATISGAAIQSGLASYTGGAAASVLAGTPSATTPPVASAAPSMQYRNESIEGLMFALNGMKNGEMYMLFDKVFESMERPNITNNVVGGGTQGQDSNMKASSAFDDELLNLLVNQIS